MAFDFNMTRLLLHEWRSSGIEFGDTACLGRQGLHVASTRLQRNLDEVGLKHVSSESILKEGNGYWEPFIRCLGGKATDSIDISDYEGASVLLDLNSPISDSYKNKYDTVIDSGTLEHVFNFPVAIKNCMELVKLNGRMIMITPSNNFMGHGFYQFSPELFFRVFSAENGFKIDNILLFEDHYIAKWYSVKDPAEVSQRVELVNGVPSYLFIVARKIAEKEIFSVVPNQSDYQQISWQQKSLSPYEIMQKNREKFSVARLVPYQVKKILSRALNIYKVLQVGIFGPRLRRDFFRRIK
jgi:hypothetical protein